MKKEESGEEKKDEVEEEGKEKGLSREERRTRATPSLNRESTSDFIDSSHRTL